MCKEYATATYANWLIEHGVKENEHVLIERGVIDKYPKRILKRNLSEEERFFYKQKYNPRKMVISYFMIPDGFIITY